MNSVPRDNVVKVRLKQKKSFQCVFKVNVTGEKHLRIVYSTQNCEKNKSTKFLKVQEKLSHHMILLEKHLSKIIIYISGNENLKDILQILYVI